VTDENALKKDQVRIDFIVSAFEAMAHHFAQPMVGPHLAQFDETGDLVGRVHDYSFDWEELCSLFEDAGLAEGFWPRSVYPSVDPRTERMQPPVYRQTVAPENTAQFLRSKEIPNAITTGYVLTTWYKFFSGYWHFAGNVTLPSGDGWLPIKQIYAKQIDRLATLGFTQTQGTSFRLHPKFLDALIPANQWDRIVGPFNELKLPKEWTD